MMTLDEAIKHAEEVACKKEREAKYIRSWEQEYDTKKWAISCEKYAKEHRQLAEWLKELKQLREQTRWIPVGEGLPKVADCYNVTRKIGSDLITSACYFDRTGNWYNDNRISQERNCLIDIIAWMPIPKEYEPESEE